jgi:hypothetical protein
MDYGDILRLRELEKRIRETDELVLRDSTVIEYTRLYNKIQNSFPKDVEELIAYTEDVEIYLGEKHDIEIGNLESSLIEAETRLKHIAESVKPYLPEDNSQKPL